MKYRVLALLVLLPCALRAQYRIEYSVAMPPPDLASHLYTIELFVSGVHGNAVELQMPVWSPGRYARMDFARNIQDLTISSTDGAPVRVERTTGSHWRVSHLPGRARSLRVHY